MADSMKQMLSKLIGLSEQVIKSANEATFFKENCYEIKSQTEKLSALFHRMMDDANSKLYERPAIRIINDTQQVLEKALSLMLSCKSFIGRIFSLVSVADFRKISSLLDRSIGDLKGPLGVWGMIATLNTGSLTDRSEAAASLLALARDSERNRKVIVEEGGIKPLLKLLKEGKIEDQKNVASAIGVMGSDPKSVERMIQTGVCTVFAKILKEGHMEVQPVVAWAVSEFAANYSTCQDIFAQHNVVRLLINHLTSGVVLEDVPNVTVINKATSTLAIVMAINHLNTSKAIEEYEHSKPNQPQQKNVSISGTSFRGGEDEVEVEDPETKAHMKAMAARALCKLLKGNSSICRMIVESRALMGFVALLDKGKADVQCYSSMALMEITAVAEQDSDLRRSTFRHNSPACKIVVDQLAKVLERENSQDILIPCIKAIGNLAKAFRVSETRIIAPLVKYLHPEERTEVEFSREVTIALTKFVCKESYLHFEHSKTILQAGAARHLIELVYFGEQIEQVSALLLLCYITLHVPDNSEKLEGRKVLKLLEWASKQSYLIQDEIFKSLLPEAKSRLERFQFSRGEDGEQNQSETNMTSQLGWHPRENSQRKKGMIEIETHVGKKIFTIKEIIGATRNFSPLMEISRDGHFGTVYKADLLSNLTVAVKKLFPISKAITQIGTEVYVKTFKLEHENLIQLLGTYSRKNLHLLIYEYMAHGSLEQALFDPTSPVQLSWETRYSICLQIAQGLEYLHTKNPPIIHRDIKASNILLDGNCKAKISNFGLAKLYEEDNPFMFIEEGGAWMYMAPEYATRKAVTMAIDIYSFGVLLLQIISGTITDENLSRHHDQTIFLLEKVANLHAIVKDANLRYKKIKYADVVDVKLFHSNYSEEQVVTIIDLAMLCTDQMASLRPTISDVVSVLKGEKTVEDVSKNKNEIVIQDEISESLQPEAKSKLERFQFSRDGDGEQNQREINITSQLSWYPKEDFQRKKAMIEREPQFEKESFAIKEIIDATGNFSSRKKIGKDGRFGTVYKAELSNFTIAVKKLFPQCEAVPEIRTEVYAKTFKLEHENLVQLLATYSQKDLHLLIYEYMDQGSLEEALFDPKYSFQLSWETRYRICLQIAQGLEYLHRKNAPIIHRDIKASNILLDGNCKAKISNFGLAKLYEEDNPFMFIEEGGTRMYMAPEYATRKAVTVAIDIFSFGILLLEIISGTKNDENLSRHPDQTIFLLEKVANLHAMVKDAKPQYKKIKYVDLVDKKLLDYSEEEVVTIIDLAMLCTDQIASLRPAISDVISVLKGEKTVEDVSKNKVKDSSSMYY